MTSCKSAKYDNCKIFSKDNQFMGYCPKKRYDWYLEKGLGELIEENTVRLLFDPVIRNPESVGKKHVERKSICVVCGDDENLRKYHVVPHAFKKWFPKILKAHVSYDVVLLCMDHVSDANWCANAYSDELFSTYKILPSDFVDKTKDAIRNYSNMILRKQKSEYPEKAETSKQKLAELVSEELTDEKIIELSNIDISLPIDGCNNSYEYVVKHSLGSDIEKIKEFILGWKDMFVENLEPEYLPSDFYEYN